MELDGQPGRSPGKTQSERGGKQEREEESRREEGSKRERQRNRPGKGRGERFATEFYDWRRVVKPMLTKQ